MVKIIIGCKGKKISVKARKLNLLGMTRGLMFRSKETENLLFNNFSGAIHSFFVFFPFLGVWLNKNNKVVHTEIVKPFTFCAKPKKQFAKLIEIPLNKRNLSIIKILVGKRNIYI